VLKLAELYTQQGLFNDARAQYLQVAEEFLKSNELDNAVRIFQKILEMDPENTTCASAGGSLHPLGKRMTLADFSRRRRTLRANSLSAAEEVLQRMLTLDPGNSYALLMQGRICCRPATPKPHRSSAKSFRSRFQPRCLPDLLKAYLKNAALSDAAVWPVNS